MQPAGAPHASKPSLNLEPDAQGPTPGPFLIEPDLKSESASAVDAAPPPCGPGRVDIQGEWKQGLSLTFVLPRSLEDLLDRYESGRGLDLVELVTAIRVDEHLGEGECRTVFLAKEDEVDLVAKEFKQEKLAEGADPVQLSLKEAEIQVNIYSSDLEKAFVLRAWSAVPDFHRSDMSSIDSGPRIRSL